MSEEEFKTDVDKTKKAIIVFRFFGWLFVFLGFVVFVIGIYYWILKKDDFNEVGDFVGGVSGSLWALAGLFFIYIAFLGQKIEIKYQQEELKLNREELRESKEVFKAQANIMLDQKLDTTFFNLLDNHRKVVNSFKEKNYRDKDIMGYEVLDNIYNELKTYFSTYSDFINNKIIYDFYITNSNPIIKIIEKEEIRILYREVYGIIDFIKNKIREENQDFYLNTLFNNLLNNEKFLLTAFNMHVDNIIDEDESILEELIFYEYNQYEFYDFTNKEKFIKRRSIWFNSGSGEKEIRLEIKEKNVYSKIEFYFVDKTSNEYSLQHFHDLPSNIDSINMQEKIHSLFLILFPNIAMDLKKEPNKRYYLDTVLVLHNLIPRCKLITFFRINVKYESDSLYFETDNSGRPQVPRDWIQNHFNNLENQES